jgi:hypothetical protein
LPWSSDEILDEPICRLELAIEGRVEVFKLTWPWGQSKEEEEFQAIADKPADPELAAKQLAAFFKRKQAADNRGRKKK